MTTKLIILLTVLSAVQGHAGETPLEETKADKDIAALPQIISTPINEPEIPSDLPPLLRLKTSPEGGKPPYHYEFEHHEKLHPLLLTNIIQKGHRALAAIAQGTIDDFPHKLEFFAGDLEKYNERWFKQGMHFGYGQEYVLKTFFYSSEYTKALDEFHAKRVAQLETYICVIWALTDYAFNKKEGFVRGSFSVIDPDLKLYRYMEKFACFSASTPQLPPAPINKAKDLEELETKELETTEQDIAVSSPDGLSTSPLDTDTLPSEDTKDQIVVSSPSPLLEPDESKGNEDKPSPSSLEGAGDSTVPTSEPPHPSLNEGRESLTFSSDSDTDVKGSQKVITQVKNLSPAIFNIWGSNFAYLRNGTSSHYANLSDIQVGIDARFASSGFALPVFPFKMTHVLWGAVQTQLGKKKTFVKFEEEGLGDVRSTFFHTLNFSSNTKGIDLLPYVRREKAILPPIAESACAFLTQLMEEKIDLGRHTWIREVMDKYAKGSKLETFFEDSKHIDISRLYKLSKQIFKDYSKPGNLRRKAQFLKEKIVSTYDEKTIKYRTGNEVVIHIDDFAKLDFTS